MAQTRTDIGRAGRRSLAQWIGVVAFNGYFWAPAGKAVCLPVLNCYSCPVGTVACPIGSLSAFATLRRAPFYVFGLLGLLGLAVGRAFCGWACPFGFLQDGLYRIRSRKWRLPRAFNALKYVLLVVLVLALPLWLGDRSGKGANDRITGEPAGVYDYCSLVCPAGTLEASVPYLVYDSAVRAKASWRTYGKIALAVAILGLAVVSRRSFCRSLCPLGALMAALSFASMLRIRTGADKCTRCMRCVKVCPMDCRNVPTADRPKEATSECVLCLDCVRNCPEQGALSATWAGRPICVSRGRSSVAVSRAD